MEAAAAAPTATHTRTYIVMPARPSTWLLFMVVWVHILLITSSQLEWPVPVLLVQLESPVPVPVLLLQLEWPLPVLLLAP